MSAQRIAIAAILGLGLLAVAWQLVWLPPARLPRGLAAALHLAPIAPGVLLVALRHRQAAFWGALGALVLFCHGVMEAWASPPARGAAALEISLCLLVILGASWVGLRARLQRRRRV